LKVKLKDIRGLSTTRAKLEVKLNGTRRMKEVLTDRLAIAKAKNEKTSKFYGVH